MSAVFFVSGAAGLAFEIVWFHRAGLVFGNSVWAASVVLSSFMGGLALGNLLAVWFARRASRLLPVYALLELVIAVTGVALTYALPELTRLLVPAIRPFADSPGAANAIRFVTAFAVIAIPATAMGATLPVLVGAWCQSRPQDLGGVLGRLYGWNTLGAVLGVVGAEVVLVPRLGVPGAAWVAAVANLCAAIAAWWISRGFESRTSVPAPVFSKRTVQSGAPWPLLAGAFLSGGALMALEVVWFRFLSMFVLNSTLAVSMMLAVVLAAIGAGGLVGATWLGRSRHAARYLPVVAVAAACAVSASYFAFRFLTSGSLVLEWYRVLWFTGSLTFAVALLSGILFTLTGAALSLGPGDEVATASRLTVANTTGAMCGPLVATFVLLPTLGMERAFAVLAATYCGVAILVALGAAGMLRLSPRTLVATAVAGCLALAAFPFGLMSRAYFPRAAEPYMADGSRIVATREGPTETIFLMEQSWLGRPVYHRLVTNGFSMSGTHLTGARYMRAFAYWPMLLRETPLKRALVICYGVGITAGAVTDVESLESIDVVEVSKDIVAMSDRIYAPEEHPLHDRRVRLHFEDGRQFLQTTRERYDLITGEPPPPLTPGTVNLYTREYFQLVHDRLAEGGMTTYWLPVPRSGEYAVEPIIRAFCDVFEDCSLWNGTLFDWMLVGTRGAHGSVSEAAFSQPWASPRVGPHLREIGFEVPEQIGATFLGDRAFLDQLTSRTLPLTDDYPRRLVAPSALSPGRAAAAPSAAPPSASRSAGELPSISFGDVLDVDRARRAFEASDFARRIWPAALVVRTGPYFARQAAMNRVMLDGANPLGRIAELHALLTESPLRRLPLWALGSNDVLQRVADAVNDGGGMVQYALGQRLLVARNYAAAANYMAEAQRRGFEPAVARALEVYALCLAGKLDDARRRAPSAMPDDAAGRTFWQWIGAHYGVGPGGRSGSGF